MTLFPFRFFKMGIVVFFTIAFSTTSLNAEADDQVRLYIPAFQGPDYLGLNVATVLNLRIFSTLRKAPFPNPKKLSFGGGMIIWGDKPLTDFSAEAAEKAAKDPEVDAQLVLWGEASTYADGVIVNAHLSLVNSDNATYSKLWQVTYAPAAIDIHLGFPSEHYTFMPIVLDPSIVALYRNPGALKIYSDKSLRKPVGAFTGNDFTAIRHEPDGEWLSEPTPGGWVPLPKLSSVPSEISDFTGAMIRIYRADWLGAKSLLNNVYKNNSISNSLRIDTLLLLGLIEEKQNLSGSKYFGEAFELNPLYKSSAAYLIMGAYSDYIRKANNHVRDSSLVERMGILLKTNRYLFDQDDEFFMRANESYHKIVKSMEGDAQAVTR